MRTPADPADAHAESPRTSSSTAPPSERSSLSEAFRRERSRIAFDIHDGPAQSIALALQQTRLLMEVDPHEHERFREIERQLLAALDELYGLMEQLRSKAPERGPFADRIEALARDFSAGSGIPVDVRVERREVQLSDHVQTALFQIVREALRNVGRHAQASSVTVAVTVAGDVIECVVDDDGKGFEPQAVPPGTHHRGYGLIGMRERARLLGGECVIEGPRGGGCRVLVRIPLQEG